MANVRSSDLNNLLMGASMLEQSQVSGYTIQAEQDADRTAVSYLVKSKYNPLGMVDFMQQTRTDARCQSDSPSRNLPGPPFPIQAGRGDSRWPPSIRRQDRRSAS